MSMSDPPVKRKRGRPPKKQPLDVYTAFTSQFQAQSSPSNPSAETNSNLMIKLGEPNTYAPVMKVSPSKSHLRLRRRRFSCMGAINDTALPSKVLSPKFDSFSLPSLPIADYGLPTPLTVRSNTTFSNSPGLALDDKVYEDMQRVISLDSRSSRYSLPNLNCNYSSYELPLSSPQCTPCLSEPPTSRSDLDILCRTLQLSPTKQDTISDQYPQTSTKLDPADSLSNPTSADDAILPSTEAFSFNLVVDSEGRAVFSFDDSASPSPIKEGFKTSSIAVQESKLNSRVVTDRQYPSRYFDEHLLPLTPRRKVQSTAECDLQYNICEESFDTKFHLTPHFNSTMNSLIGINSPQQQNWPVMSDLCQGIASPSIKHQSDPGSANNCRDMWVDTSNLYKTINISSLPCPDGGDARVALRKAFSM